MDESDLNETQIDNIINKQIFVPIKYINKNPTFKTTFKYKEKSKIIYIFYSFRNKKGKSDINKKNFI